VLGAATWRTIGVWHDSETLWSTTLARNPDCLPCHINIGMLVVDDDPETAIAHYERALALDPRDDATLRRLGYACALVGRDVEAEAAYRQALRIKPNNRDAHYGLANALQRQQKYDEAVPEYQEALRLDPHHPDTHQNLGITWFTLGRLEDAQAEFEEALRLHPRDADAEAMLATVAQQRGNSDAANSWYESALRDADSQDKKAMTHTRFAEALLAQGRVDRAATQFRAALELNPLDVETVVATADALWAAGREAEAIDALQKGIARIPNVPRLAGALAWRYATSRDARWRNGAEAVRLAEHACQVTSNTDADLLDTLAAAYAEVGRYADAVRTAGRGLELAGDDWGRAADAQQRLSLYRMNQPYRQP
jgi:tetratricopeptide (TPR) repeat protein